MWRSSLMSHLYFIFKKCQFIHRNNIKNRFFKNTRTFTMLRFRNILNFPSAFRTRQNSVLKLNPIIQNAFIDENGYLVVSGTVKNYNVAIQFESEKVDTNSLIKVSCSCPSFNFEFAKTLLDQNSLYQPENFNKAILRNPKKKNAFSIPSPCKHIIAFARFVDKNQFRLGI